MITAIKFVGLTILSHFAIAAADAAFHKAKDKYKERKDTKSDMKGCDSEEATI